MVTDSLVLLFTQHKNAWLAAITSQPLRYLTRCLRSTAVLPQASLQNQIDSQKNYLDLKQIH